MKILLAGAFALLALASCSTTDDTSGSNTNSSLPTTSGWVTKAKVKPFVRRYLSTAGKGAYPTKISCRFEGGRTEFKLDIKAVGNGGKPFYKWFWVEGKASELAALAAAVPLSDQPQRKYRIVSKDNYTGADGSTMGCALLYR